MKASDRIFRGAVGALSLILVTAVTLNLFMWLGWFVLLVPVGPAIFYGLGWIVDWYVLPTLKRWFP